MKTWKACWYERGSQSNLNTLNLFVESTQISDIINLKSKNSQYL